MPCVWATRLDARALADLTPAESADLLIIGGGIAGMCAALEAPRDARIVVLDKGESSAGSSPLAQGGMAAAVGPDDSPDAHAADTIAAGDGLCNAEIVHDICAEGPAAVAWLSEMGVRFDRSPDGSLHVAREGAQTFARSVHRLDGTGAEIVKALREALRGRNIGRLRVRADALAVKDGVCVGAFADEKFFAAGMTLIATGGAGGLWGRTTNQAGATADGLVIALAAGARAADLEFMQFHPTALAAGGLGQRVLLTEALRGDGALLIDENGERFVDELAPRSVVSRAILERGRVFLDARNVDDLEQRFPTVVNAVRAHGLDPVSQPIPVEPAAHYYIGGIATDSYGRTNIEHLFAAGEAASTGFDGANRMAGNSLLQAVVVGRRVGAGVKSGLPAENLEAKAPTVLPEVPEGLSELVWSCAGPIRSQKGLDSGNARLKEMAPTPHVQLIRAIIEAAQHRIETRGVHTRSDYPTRDPDLASRTFMTTG